jgi:hypothetical protein
VSGEVDGDRLDLELACNLRWQGCPGIDVGTGAVEQVRDIWCIAPAQPAQHCSPRKIPLDRFGAECRPVAYVPHSLCL